MKEGSVLPNCAHEDRDAVASIKEALDDLGLDVWLRTNSLRTGDDFVEESKRSLQECLVFVPVISKHWLFSAEMRFLHREWA